MDKTVFLVKPPLPEESGKYALIVYRPMTMMGGQPVIVFIDKMTLANGVNQGLRGKDMMVRFPAGMPYIMVDRRYTELMTPVEMALMHRSEAKEVHDAVGEEEEHSSEEIKEGVVEISPLHTGQYV